MTLGESPQPLRQQAREASLRRRERSATALRFVRHLLELRKRARLILEPRARDADLEEDAGAFVAILQAEHHAQGA